MNVVGKVGNLISQGVYTVATPFHPFGGAVDIIVVQQEDGSFRSTPWYVRFGKFQGVLKRSEKKVRINVNGNEAKFHMYLDNSGEAYFSHEADPGEDSDGVAKDVKSRVNGDLGKDSRLESTVSYPSGVEASDILYSMRERLERSESDACNFYDFQDDESSIDGSMEFSSEYGSSRFENLEGLESFMEAPSSDSEMVLVSIDGRILTAPISSFRKDTENVEVVSPQFHLGPRKSSELCEGKGEDNSSEIIWTAGYQKDIKTSPSKTDAMNIKDKEDVDQLDKQEVGEEEYEHENQVGDVLNQESDIHVHKNVEGALFSVKNDEEEMQSEISVVGIHEDACNGDGEVQSENCLAEIVEKGQDKPDTEHPQDNQTSKEVEVRNEGEIKIGNVLNSTSTGVNGSVDHAEGTDVISYSDDKRVTESGIYEATPSSPNKDSVEADISIRDEVEQEKDLSIAESVSDGSDSDNIDRNLTIRTKSSLQEASKSSPNGDASAGFELSICRHLLRPGMGIDSAAEAFNEHSISEEEFKLSATSIIKDENLVVRLGESYIPWDKAAHVVLGKAVFGLDLPVEPKDAIPVEQKEIEKPKDNEADGVSTPGRRWSIWPMSFRRSKTLEPSISNASSEDIFLDSEASHSPNLDSKSSHKKFVRTNIPTSEEIASLNLKDGQNVVTFSFCTRVWGLQRVEAHIYMWKWNARIVISDVDGTITKSDVLGQFMPLVGRDWSQSGVAKLFSAIKENGYQLLFLSARAIVQAYLTRSFLLNLKQDGNTLPDGPVVISPDGLFPSLFREVIRRAPHEFKIACLQDIKALFPADYNPFYAGFGNRDTDELSYRKIGIPKGKIFIINPKGEVAISHRIDVKSYTSLHTLVNDMFPPTSLIEQEDYNHWNYWKIPIADVEDL